MGLESSALSSRGRSRVAKEWPKAAADFRMRSPRFSNHLSQSARASSFVRRFSRVFCWMSCSSFTVISMLEWGWRDSLEGGEVRSAKDVIASELSVRCVQKPKELLREKSGEPQTEDSSIGRAEDCS